MVTSSARGDLGCAGQRRCCRWQSLLGAVSLAFASLSGAIIVMLAGLLSDEVGRVPVYLWSAIYQLVMALPVWWLLSRHPVLHHRELFGGVTVRLPRFARPSPLSPTVAVTRAGVP